MFVRLLLPEVSVASVSTNGNAVIKVGSDYIHATIDLVNQSITITDMISAGTEKHTKISNVVFSHDNNTVGYIFSENDYGGEIHIYHLLTGQLLFKKSIYDVKQVIDINEKAMLCYADNRVTPNQALNNIVATYNMSKMDLFVFSLNLKEPTKSFNISVTRGFKLLPQSTTFMSLLTDPSDITKLGKFALTNYEGKIKHFTLQNCLPMFLDENSMLVYSTINQTASIIMLDKNEEIIELETGVIQPPEICSSKVFKLLVGNDGRTQVWHWDVSTQTAKIIETKMFNFIGPFTNTDISLSTANERILDGYYKVMNTNNKNVILNQSLADCEISVIPNYY